MNVEVTRQLAGLSRRRHPGVFSTDLVFDGTKGSYREEDPPRPLMVCGETKAEAEVEVLKNPKRSDSHLNQRRNPTVGRLLGLTRKCAMPGGPGKRPALRR